MDEIIKKAIEGGYIYIKDNSQSEIDYKIKIFTENFEICVLQSLFWQSLGKAYGWHLEEDEGGDNWSDEWYVHAMKFYEINLTEGWEKAVSYLSELIK